MNHRLIPAVAILMAGLLCVSGCTTYKPIAPADVGGYDEIRLKTTDGKREYLREPRTVADTIVGLRSSGDTLRVSLRRVEEVSVGKLSVGKTVVMTTAIAVSVAALGFAIFAATDPCMAAGC